MIIIIVLLALTWVPDAPTNPSRTRARQAEQSCSINKLTSTEFIAYFDRALATHWQHSQRALHWARQYRVSSRLTATLTPQRTGVNLVGDSYWHLARVIETLTSLLVKVSACPTSSD